CWFVICRVLKRRYAPAKAAAPCRATTGDGSEYVISSTCVAWGTVTDTWERRARGVGIEGFRTRVVLCFRLPPPLLEPAFFAGAAIRAAASFATGRDVAICSSVAMGPEVVPVVEGAAAGVVDTDRTRTFAVD